MPVSADALGGAGRELGELALAAAAVVLDVHEDAGPLPGPTREHEVDEVLERRQALALAADQRPEGLPVGAVADDVEPARLALADLDRHALEAEVAHQRLEDLLARGQRLGRRLGRLELGALHGERATGRRHRGDLGRRQLGAVGSAGAGAVVAARGAVVTPRAAVVAARRAVVTTRRAIAALGAGGLVAVGARGGAVVATRRAIAVVAARAAVAVVAARAAILVRAILAGRRGRQRRGLGRLALGSRATEGAARGRDDPGGLGAHPQHAARAGREDLEVEVAEADAERVAGRLDGLLDRLAGELLVFAHDQRRLPRRPLRVRLGRIVDWAEMSLSTDFARSCVLG